VKAKPKPKPPQLNKTNARALKLTLERRAMQRVFAFALNEWERRYVHEPARFEAEMLTTERFLLEDAGGKLPSYGVVCARYLVGLLVDLTKPKHAPKPSLKSSHRTAKKKSRRTR
jgi:hypothetical protein